MLLQSKRTFPEPMETYHWPERTKKNLDTGKEVFQLFEIWTQCKVMQQSFNCSYHREICLNNIHQKKQTETRRETPPRIQEKIPLLPQQRIQTKFCYTHLLRIPSWKTVRKSSRSTYFLWIWLLWSQGRSGILLLGRNKNRNFLRKLEISEEIFTDYSL